MNFLVDAGVGKKVENLLLSKGHDVVSVMNDNPQASDSSILNAAALSKRIVITMDKDFGELVFSSGFDHDGVLLLRLGAMNGDEKSNVMNEILENYSTQLQGNFSVYKTGKLRIRNK